MPSDQNPHQSVTRFGVHRIFNVHVRVFLCPKCKNFAQNDLHLKSCFFFAKICIFCNAIFSSAVQAYKQPYSFGGRMKLIICQIRHELSVTITIRWWTQYKQNNRGPSTEPYGTPININILAGQGQNKLHLKSCFFLQNRHLL